MTENEILHGQSLSTQSLSSVFSNLPDMVLWHLLKQLLFSRGPVEDGRAAGMG
jgi:Na+-transporting NADH:ubiquinone oxidoreductase subunit NqrA